ncbi:MAG: IS1182 family transposase [Nitrospirota bacterium]|jgi:transposase|nr:IS1182 family transposase [Nitrospira sp.]MDH5349035.1 IS1182 family transposase [Nitrospira sp.]MDH5574150.1 IS1182 family transposase [Nitrospirota bacterium]
MSGFIQGTDRHQATLFPERLDEYIAEDNAVRVIDVFVDDLDLSGLGFKTYSEKTGRPAYHPTILLKLYVYGYLNRVQSSRRLEREAHRNVELMWLTGRLAPDFKTIADFRKNNGPAIRLVCREFILLCKKLHLFADAFVAIDGSKFKAVNNRDRNFTKAKMQRRLQQIDESIERYLRQIASADRQEAAVATDNTQRLEDKITALKTEMARLKKLEVQMLQTPDQQLSLTDPDARSMKTRGNGIVGYNVQTAVDAEHHLIVAHEVINTGSDRHQLYHMAQQAKEAIGSETLEVVADRGYFTSEEILACEQSKITTYLPKPQTSGSTKKGLFSKRDFMYKAEDDEYECPAGERLIRRFETQEKGLTLHKYWSSHCPNCSMKSQCTTGTYRRVTRWEHEAVLEAAEARLDREPERMRIRRQTVEHPFGTLKAWMGYTHFQTKTLKQVRTEMSLHVLAYNVKRVLAIFGVTPLLQAIQT